MEPYVHEVKATREGRIGHTTASGYIIEETIPFVALPSRQALHKTVWIQNPVNNIGIAAIVLDVGPWNIDDNQYVFGRARPQAESGTDNQGRPTNESGIDLGEKVWLELAMRDNTIVKWYFT